MVGIRKLNSGDLEYVHAWEKDRLVQAFFNSGTKLYLSNDLSDYPNYYIIVLNQQPIGCTQIKLWKDAIVTSYYLGAKAFRGKGLASLATQARIKYIKEVFPNRNIYSYISEVNYPAWKVLLDNGFYLTDIKDKGSKIEFQNESKFFAELKLVLPVHEQSQELKNQHSKLYTRLYSNRQRLLTSYQKIVSEM